MIFHSSGIEFVAPTEVSLKIVAKVLMFYVLFSFIRKDKKNGWCVQYHYSS